MSEREPSAMRFRRVQTRRDQNGLWLIRGLSSAVACVGLMLAFCTVTGNAYSLWFLLTGAALCVIHSTLNRWGKGWLFFAAGLSLLLGVVLFARPQLLEGFRLLWNQFSDHYLLGTGYVLPEWKNLLPESQAGISRVLGLLSVSLILSFVSALLTVSAPWLLAALPGAVLLAELCLLRTAVSLPVVLTILGCGALVLTLSCWTRIGHPQPGLWSGALCALVCAGFLLPLTLPGSALWGERISEKIHQQLHENRYENSYTTLPEGDFRDYKATESTAQPALVVTMDQPRRLYLRGFTGEVFQSDRWITMDRETLVKNRDLLYWLNLNAFDPDAQYHSASLYSNLAISTVTVQNIGACSAWRYVPYTLMGGGTDPEDLNSGVSERSGERVYSYQTVSGEPALILELLRTSQQPEVLSYRKAEGAYRTYVYHHYLQIPEEVIQMLESQWVAAAEAYGGREQLTPQQAQTCAMAFLSACFSDTGVTDAFELPLPQAEGSSFQYATVAVLTLRWFGIPARYAEGYVISTELAASAEPGQSLTVDSSCARAWVEVYQDGIGWMPMDLTPGLGELIEYEPDEGQNQSEGEEEDEEKPPEEDEEDSPIEDEQEVPDTLSGTVVRILKQLSQALPAILLMILGLLLLLWIRRTLILRNRAQRYADPDRKQAVSLIASDTVSLLKLLGFDWGIGSLQTLAQPLEEAFGPEFAAGYRELVELNHRALFRAKAMEDEDRQNALHFRDTVIGKLKTEQKWYKRLWQKWVRCLY